MLDFIQSKKLLWVFFAAGSAVVLLLVFQLGVFVGIKKAGFSRNWGENYSRNFGILGKGPLSKFEGREFFGGHGAVGTIIKIDEQGLLVIKGQDGIERVIKLSDNATILRGRESLDIMEIKIDDEAVIIGSPNADGTVSAKMIRIFSPGGQLMPFNR